MGGVLCKECCRAGFHAIASVVERDYCFHDNWSTVRCGMAGRTQAESVIKNIIREICLECSSQGKSVSETLAAFMVSHKITSCVGGSKSSVGHSLL